MNVEMSNKYHRPANQRWSPEIDAETMILRDPFHNLIMVTMLNIAWIDTRQEKNPLTSVTLVTSRTTGVQVVTFQLPSDEIWNAVVEDWIPDAWDWDPKTTLSKQGQESIAFMEASLEEWLSKPAPEEKN